MPAGENAASRAPAATPGLEWLYRSQEELAAQYMKSRGGPASLARQLTPALACLLCYSKDRIAPAAGWLPLPPDYPDPSWPVCGSCWPQGLYCLLLRDTTVYHL